MRKVRKYDICKDEATAIYDPGNLSKLPWNARSALRHFSYTPRHYGNAAISEQI